MALGSGRSDPELLNSIFRAAHSIKGGSGTFGFTQLADATHEMETLFDALRKGRGVADETTVRLLLDSCDAFKAHLARLKAGERGSDPAMVAMHERLARYVAAAPGAAAAVPAAPAAAREGLLHRRAAPLPPRRRQRRPTDCSPMSPRPRLRPAPRRRNSASSSRWATPRSSTSAAKGTRRPTNRTAAKATSPRSA